MNEPNNGARALEIMSARRPLPRRLESTGVPMISPTARMSAEVSTMVTTMTISIDRIAATWNCGAPKCSTSGMATHGPCSAWEKSAMPVAIAASVPITIASRIDRRDRLALPSLLSSSTEARVNAARPMFAGLPKSAAWLLPPMAQRAVTGIRVRPMVVMTMPVTKGGKYLMMRENSGVISRPTSDDTITAPNTTCMPPVSSLPMIATMVATLAKETPCTSGKRQPKKGMPKVCSNVARPPANSEAAISRPTSPALRPAAWPMISGTAIMPPYMVSTCCRP
ncbi:hypothetical protein D3C76_906430 [compost metagenome]